MLSGMQCYDDVEFFAITKGAWTYYNIFGIAPLKSKKAPKYVQALKHNKVIDKQTVFLYLNPD